MYGYVIIDKVTKQCCQTIISPISSWSIDNDTHFSMEVPVASINSYSDKYYYDGKWYERVYNRYETIVKKDEHGNVISETIVPLEEYGYVDNELNL